MRRWRVKDDFEILRRPCSDVLNLVLVASSDESNRAGPKLCYLVDDCHFYFAFADEKHFFLLVVMGVMRRTPWQQKDFVDVDVNAIVRQTIQNWAEGGVCLFLSG
jgi:hypothetical protein